MPSQDRIISIISWVANVPPTNIQASTHLKDDLEMDSLDIMLLITKLENIYQVRLSTDEIEKIETVQDANRFFSKVLS